MIWPGIRVTFDTPDNPRLHGTEGVVKTRTHYGAICHAPAAATGEFRAHWTEMITELGAISEQVADEIHSLAASGYGHANGATNMAYGSNAPPVEPSRAMGYSGEVCRICQGMKVVRVGTCLRCDDCGSTTGCD